MDTYINPEPGPHRGAPAGNTNALKHGFYSRRLKTLDQQTLNSFEFRGLDEEITLVRTAMHQVCDYYAGLTDKEDVARFLVLVCSAASTLNRLIRTQAFLKLDQADFHSALSDALKIALDKLRRDPDDEEGAPGDPDPGDGPGVHSSVPGAIQDQSCSASSGPDSPAPQDASPASQPLAASLPPQGVNPIPAPPLRIKPNPFPPSFRYPQEDGGDGLDDQPLDDSFFNIFPPIFPDG